MIIDALLPRKCKMLTLDTFDGFGNTTYKMDASYAKIVLFNTFDAIMCIAFPFTICRMPKDNFINSQRPT